MRTVVADTWFRITHSWWATWALLAGFLSAVLTRYGWGTIAATPLLAMPAIIAAHPQLRARAIAGLKLWPRATAIRCHWATWMRASTGDPFRYTSSIGRAIVVGATKQTPRIKRMERRPAGVAIVAECPRFFDATMWRQGGDDLARGLRLPRPQVSIDRAGQEVTLLFAGGDGTIRQYSAGVPARLGDLTRLPVARTHTGPAHIRVLGTHILITGATGSGKGSVVWSLVRELAPGVRDGAVELWAIDPKGGIELGMGRGMFTRFVSDTDNPETIARLLDDVEAVMNTRLARMEGVTRLHTPRPGDPLFVLIVDEFLSLTIGITDPAVRRRIDAAFIRILSKGRAPGVTVIAAAQISQKEAIGHKRDLIPTRVSLRVTDSDQVDLSLGSGARKAGALADQIPDNAPGTGYLLEDGRTPVLVRFPWMDDDAIRAMAATHRPRHTTPPAPVADKTAGTQERASAAPKRAALERLLADPATADLPDEALAAAAQCSLRYVRMLRPQLAAHGNGAPETVGAVRNKVPSGDPTSPRRHFGPDTQVPVPDVPWLPAPLAAPVVNDPTVGWPT